MWRVKLMCVLNYYYNILKNHLEINYTQLLQNYITPICVIG